MKELGLDWSAPEELPAANSMNGSCHQQAPRRRLAPFFLEVHQDLSKMWCAPFPVHDHSSSSAALSTVDSTEEKGYTKFPPVEEAVAVHLCLPTAIGWKTMASHSSKTCRTTSALPSRVFAADGQAVSALHTRLQVRYGQPSGARAPFVAESHGD